MPTSLEVLQERIRAFAFERDWGKYHDPKNLVMLLASEVGELIAEFRWLTAKEAAEITSDAQRMQRITEEIGDIGIALLELCDKTHIDLSEAIAAKIALNEARYPVEAARGRPDRPSQPR